MSNPTPEEIETVLMGHLDSAMGMRLNMGSEDTDYDLNFIYEKLKLVTIFQERLSDIMMKLTKISLSVVNNARVAKTLHLLKEKELKASSDYRELPNNEKGHWLVTQLAELSETSDTWQRLQRTVSEVKEAVAERVGALKRLDSDIRLHSKLYESRVAAGATSPTSYVGNNTDEIDLN